MKINEVEALAGITKKNIRFYEEQGLLSPRRNSENGYRDYGEEELRILQRIRLLRKLDVPIEEIRQMLTGAHTVGDGMRRHIIRLEREQRNLEQSIRLCTDMQNMEIPLASLDCDTLLQKMEELERGGTLFPDPRKQDISRRYLAPVLTAVGIVAMSVALSGLLLWAYQTQPEDAPPFWFLLVIIGVFAAMGIGAVIALAQRIREIQKGEIDDAKYY